MWVGVVTDREGLSDVALGQAVLALLALLQTSMAEILVVNLVSSLLQILEVCPEGEERGEGRGERRGIGVSLKWRLLSVT